MPGGINPPIGVMASWPAPNYVNPVTRAWGVVILAAILSACSFVIVSARLWARIRLRNVGIDDWIILVAMIPAIGMSAMICIASKMYGFDRHIWDNPISVSIDSRKVVMVIEALYVFSTGLIKVSILLFYRRLVAGTVSRTFVWAVRITIFTVVAYMITFENTLIFGCKPIKAYWLEVNPIWRGLNDGQYKCLDEVATLYAANITSIVQDFLTFLMPLLLFRKLHLPIRQKIVLGAIFGVGFFICIVGIVRIIYTENLYFHTYDASWASEPIWLWTIVELHGAIMCASAPALKVFFKRYLRVGSSNKSNEMPGRTPLGGMGPSGGSGNSRPLRDPEKAMKYVDVSYGTQNTETTTMSFDANEVTMWSDKTIDMETDADAAAYNGLHYYGTGSLFGDNYSVSLGPSTATTLRAQSPVAAPVPISMAGSPARKQSGRNLGRGEAGFGFSGI